MSQYLILLQLQQNACSRAKFRIRKFASPYYIYIYIYIYIYYNNNILSVLYSLSGYIYYNIHNGL